MAGRLRWRSALRRQARRPAGGTHHTLGGGVPLEATWRSTLLTRCRAAACLCAQAAEGRADEAPSKHTHTLTRCSCSAVLSVSTNCTARAHWPPQAQSEK